MKIVPGPRCNAMQCNSNQHFILKGIDTRKPGGGITSDDDDDDDNDEKYSPVNLQINPSAEVIPEMIPPEAARSRAYLQFQATR